MRRTNGRVTGGSIRGCPAKGVPRKLRPRIPGAWLEALATIEAKLRVNEWRVLALVLASSRPITGFQLAQRLGLNYRTTKRAVRGLVEWNILRRTPDGLVFQPDGKRWGLDHGTPGESTVPRPKPAPRVLYLTLRQTAAALSLHPQTVRDYLRRGELDGRLIGRRWRVSRKAIDRFVAGAPQWWMSAES